MKSIVMLICSVVMFIGHFHYALASTRLPAQIVILQYHHVADDTPNSTSVSPETFRQHMQYISQHHKVIRLKDALETIQNGGSLPANAIAITFDDGYENILSNAHSILARYNFPYTVFINPASINTMGDQLTWDQVQEMRPLADFANHTLDHLHLLERKAQENEQQWLGRVMSNIETAEQDLQEKLGYSYKWLAYPYGEYNFALQKALRDAGYIGFGQQSGVMAAHSNFSALPRFPAAGRYANLDTLKVKMSAIAMPIVEHLPADHQRVSGSKMESFTLVLADDHADMQTEQLACYFKGERLIPSVTGTKISLALDHVFTPGRARINCTAPSVSERGRFYWHSVPFFTPTEQGVFLD